MDVFVLFGQTASGKTAKALELAKQCNGEIVNFDSRQLYKKLDIVTGKDRPTDPKYKIWLYDIVDPKETFSSTEYVSCAEEVIRDILSRGKTPILVGGTGYYVRHLLFGTPEIDVKEDWSLRKQLESKTVLELQTLLVEKNSQMLEQMNNSDRNNPRRLIRRIEIFNSGKTLPAISQQETFLTHLAIKYLSFFHPSTTVVREKITKRVEERIAAGAIDEVKNLLKEGYSKDDPGLKAIGYKQLIEYIEKAKTLDEAKIEWINKEVQYAKRQKTYFKKYFPA